jgi:hypothetical protein
MHRPANWLPWRRSVLRDELRDVWSKGTLRPENGYHPGPQDRFYTFDDSPEATDRWVARFIASRGKLT